MQEPRHAEIIEGLRRTPACISPKYFYDERGSRLFEAITRLPEYYPTRTEHAILQASGADIARAIGQGCTLIEPGAGSCAKAGEWVILSMTEHSNKRADVADPTKTMLLQGFNTSA